MDLKLLRSYDRQAAKGVSSNPHVCDAGFFYVQKRARGIIMLPFRPHHLAPRQRENHITDQEVEQLATEIIEKMNLEEMIELSNSLEIIYKLMSPQYCH
jgi:pyridoxine 5'-phosphate synthase PdxJ